MATIVSTIKRQYELFGLISRAVDNLNKLGAAKITNGKVQSRIDTLNHNWNKFQIHHESLLKLITEEEEYDYFKDDIYSNCEEKYIDAKGEMLDILDALSKKTEPANDDVNSQKVNRSFHLPKIELPTFSGNYTQWSNFHDLFSSMVVTNSDLTPVEKLHYLKMSLVDEPAQLLKNIEICSDNFVRAWNILIERYENKRILIDSHLSSLFNIYNIKQESSNEIKRLIGKVKESLGALKSLGCPVESWDQILVFMIVHKLDSESLKDWEKSIGSKKDPATFAELETFLIGRIHSLEAIEQISKNSKLPGLQSSNVHSRVKTHNVSTLPQSCALCKAEHYISSCQQYLSKTPSQRKDFITSKGLCFNCLGPHLLRNCRTAKRCRVCQKQHHSSLHNSLTSSTKVNTVSPVSAIESTSQQSPTSQICNSPMNTQVICNKNVLLATAIITIDSEVGKCQVRALIDQGSEVSFVSESLVQLLHLQRTSTNISISGIAAQTAGYSRGVVSLRFFSKLNPSTEYNVKALILPKLTSYLPPKKLYTSNWKHLQGIPLADKDYFSQRPIDVILGADVYAEIIQEGIRRGNVDAPIAQKTTLGWILSGTVGTVSKDRSIHSYQCSVDFELRELMQRFWLQEDVSSIPKLTQEDKECEEHFKQTHHQNSKGRYVVRLPLKRSPEEVGDSYTGSLRCLISMEKKFAKDPVLKQRYSAFMSEYLALNHMEKVADYTTSGKQFFLPHHGVIRETSTTTKLRVVFNGSHKTSKGFSLNDCLHVGPKLQSELTDVLLRWRLHRFVFASDIEKMYRQIIVHPDDRSLQRILWRNDPNDPVSVYQLSTVTYGLACAPYLALRCLRQTAHNTRNTYPLAENIILHDTYVDDILSGADDILTAKSRIDHVRNALKSSGFITKKWIANNPAILDDISPDELASTSIRPFNDECPIRTLGIIWSNTHDSFKFNWQSLVQPKDSVLTKRTVLSQIAQLFDPLGWLSPITVSAKIFMQQLWLQQLDWDTELPPQLSPQWCQFLNELENISTITIPRWLGTMTDSKLELHGFSDASKKALGAVVYCRVYWDNSEPRITLITAKTKVAPLKLVTMPRLELCAAVLLTRLVKRVQQTLNVPSSSIHLWTDSSIVLSWINSNPSRWKDFVQHRLIEIQELSTAKWHHISGKDNPADLASRGLSAAKLLNEQLWWNGPAWLTQPASLWPRTQVIVPSDTSIEERRVHANVTNPVVNPIWSLIDRYSNLTKLLRVTAWCIRFIKKLKEKSLLSFTVVLSPQELNDALMLWVRQTQQQYFHEDFKLLNRQKYLPKSNALHRLCPFVDDDGFLRLSGRLQFANSDWNEKHPLIIPKESALTTLLIDHHHRKNLHAGTQVTLASLRQQFWVIGGRIPVRSFIHRCVVCARLKATCSQEIMGQLPSARVNPGRPFLNSGIDYAGPFLLRTFRGRGAKTYKGYLIVFVCLATSAVHLEAVTDYTTAGFIAAYKRFTGRRGICASLTSDCGTNLIGADKELRALLKSSSSSWKTIASNLANDGTIWKFNPPSAPHFGGKWEAAVKATKFHLKRVVGTTLLTYEEFSTLLVEIEGVLNSRPLCPLTDDPNDINSLTPSHFLIGGAIASIPEPSLVSVNSGRLSRWQLLRKFMEQFWVYWSKYYLQHIQNRSKWFNPKQVLHVGALVLIKDERMPPSKWPLARVTHLYDGPDGRQRVAVVKTATSSLTRPVAKLCMLPIN